MKIIGLTGGIGSGKSTVAKMFEDLGTPIFIADDVSKKLLQSDVEVMAAVKQLLGDSSYYTSSDGTTVADRKFIASKVFNDKDLLEKLNAILHPAVRAYFNNWINEQCSSYIIYEAAILFESGSHKLCDYVLLVSTNLEDRIERVMNRDQVTRKEVQARLNNQWTDLERLNLSNFVIINHNLINTKEYVSILHDVLLKL